MLYVRVLNMLKDNITDEDDRVMVGDDDDAEWLTPREMRDKIKYFDEKIAKYVDELDFLYPLVNKSIKNLPVFKIGTEFNEIERNIFDLVGTNKLQKNQRVKWQKQKLAMTRKIQMELEESKEKREEERHQQDVDAHKHLTTPVADADLKNVSSAWLLPDGRMFGGVGYAFIHDHIRFYLKETGFFKDLKIQVDDEKILEKLGWCKLSMGHGFMMYDRDYSDKRFTEAQHAKIIDWAIARERPFVKINARKIPLKHLMNMTPDDLMDYREWRDSDKNPDLGNPEMILNDDDTEEEMLEYFSPDVQEKMRRNLMVRSVMEKIEKVEDKETEDDDND